MATKGVDVFFVLPTKESPLQKLVAPNYARGIGGIHLAFDYAFKNLKDFTPHFSSFRHRELEEKHTHVSFDLMHLVLVLTRGQSMDELNLWVVLDQKFFGYFHLF